MIKVILFQAEYISISCRLVIEKLMGKWFLQNKFQVNSMKKIILLCFIVTQITPRRNPPQWIIYNTNNSPLPSNNIRHIVVDNNNRKWIATDCDALVMIDESGWHIFTSTNSELPSNCIMSLAVDYNNALWLGGWNDYFHLARFNGTDWMVWNESNSPLPYNYVNSITFDSTNKVWLQSNNPPILWHNHLFSFDGDTTWQNETYFSSSDGWRKILISGDSIIIATTTYVGKLFIIKNDGSNYEIGDYPGTYVTDLKKDLSGNIWIAAGYADWGNLVKYDGVSFTVFNIWLQALK
jgi:hypothetical protein